MEDCKEYFKGKKHQIKLPKDVNSWTIEQTGSWIDSLQKDLNNILIIEEKESWKGKFEKGKIKGSSLLKLEDKHLEKLGFEIGEVVDIIDSIQKLKGKSYKLI